MKFVVLVFGALGFGVVAIAGFSADRQPDLILRDAALGCLVTAFAGRWFWRVLDRAFAETVAARRATAAAAEAAAAAATVAAANPSLSTSNKTVPARPALQPKAASSSR